MTTPVKQIDTLYAFVATDPEDLTEGVLALERPNGLGTDYMPMVGADLERVNDLRPHAERAAREQNVQVRLLHFTAREEVEVIEP
jgi:hypothetical protein